MRKALIDFCAYGVIVSAFLCIIVVVAGIGNFIEGVPLGTGVRGMALVGIIGFCVSFACGTALSWGTDGS